MVLLPIRAVVGEGTVVCFKKHEGQPGTPACELGYFSEP